MKIRNVAFAVKALKLVAKKLKLKLRKMKPK